MDFAARVTSLLANRVAAKHRRAAWTLEKVAERHMDTATYMRDTGDAQRAVLEVRSAILNRQFAQLQRDRAQLEAR